MKTAIARSLLALALLALPASAFTRKFRLYDTGTGAKIDSAFKFKWSSTAGTVAAVVAGEAMSGEYSITQMGSFGWGSIFSAGGTASMSSIAIGAGKGAFLMTGPSGRVLECEFVTNAATTHGNGGCKDNRGSLYRLIF